MVMNYITASTMMESIIKISKLENTTDYRNKIRARDLLYSISGHNLRSTIIESLREIARSFSDAIYTNENEMKIIETKSITRTKYFSDLLSRKFGLVIIDEAHNLKNDMSVRSIACMHLRAKNYLFMSASPTSGKLHELNSYLAIGYGPRHMRHNLDISQRYYDDLFAKHNTNRVTNRPLLVCDDTSNYYIIDSYNNLSDFSSTFIPTTRLYDLVDRNIIRVSRNDKDIVMDKEWHFDIKEQKASCVPSSDHMALYAAQMEVVYNATVKSY
jgi:SNF2 family DNA or RNA helicase